MDYLQRSDLHYRKGYKYQLAESYYINTRVYPDETIHTDFLSLYRSGLMIIHKGYAWDGASGPTIDTESTMAGSLVHDALYQLMRLELIPRTFRWLADRLMQRIMLSEGMHWFRNKYFFAGVKWFGDASTRTPNPIITIKAKNG